MEQAHRKTHLQMFPALNGAASLQSFWTGWVPSRFLSSFTLAILP